jgi:hypothetical protein
MSRRLRTSFAIRIGATALLIFMLITAAAAADEGTIRTVKVAGSDFDEYTGAPSQSAKEWMRSNFWRMIVYSPYFDSRTGWYPDAWVYRDAYAVYPSSNVPKEHPEWIFKGPSGEKLYVPYACANGTCPEYAGNIANAGFRQRWIEEEKATLAAGYKGLYIDDVNMEFNVGNGQEQRVAPIDPATGKQMTYTAWRQYMAQFMEQIRAALPGIEIIHNVVWFSDGPSRIADPYIQREIKAANGVFLERGANDAGLTGGTGIWSLNAFLSYAEGVNALGAYFVLGDGATDQQGQEYDLAAYFLISNGSDAIDVGPSTPRKYWRGWDIELGKATGGRYMWEGLMRRDFTGGTVLLNEPGAATRTVRLAKPMENTAGAVVSSVKLAASSGVVLKIRKSGAKSLPNNEPAQLTETPLPEEDPLLSLFEAPELPAEATASPLPSPPSGSGAPPVKLTVPSSSQPKVSSHSKPEVRHKHHRRRRRRATLRKAEAHRKAPSQHPTSPAR